VLDRPYDRLIAITRSGTTTEILQALERLDGRIPVTVITADPTSPVAGLGEVISLGIADEQSVVQSRTATTAIAMFRWHLGVDLAQAADQAADVLAL
jgi:D-arabinose 5-phosphate isomerase GutQ